MQEPEIYKKFYDNPNYYISNHFNIKHKNGKILKKYLIDGKYHVKLKHQFYNTHHREEINRLYEHYYLPQPYFDLEEYIEKLKL